ncbi:MAG: amidohydrolase family protein [Gaiellales bacterium]
MLDLSAIPLVDNHCHGLFRDDGPMDAPTMRARFSESAGEPFPTEHTTTSLHYLWAIRQMAARLGCEPGEQAVLSARAALSETEIDRLYLDDAGIAWLLVDDGYPDPARCCDRESQARRTGSRIGWVERVEAVAARLVGEHRTFATFDDALRDHLASARARGVCGLKSVAAYRSGLAVDDPVPGEAADAFDQMRRAGRTRLDDKPLVDHVVLRAMEAARRQELPVQFHTGYGDADADLLLADPLHLRPLLHRFPTVPVVMLHGAYPYTRKLGVLAATYGNAYVDVSYAIPFLTGRELLSVTRQALAAAPGARILYSSDGVGLPEHYWLGAVRGRQALGSALGELVDAGELDHDQALDVAALIMHANAERIYALTPAT